MATTTRPVYPRTSWRDNTRLLYWIERDDTRWAVYRATTTTADAENAFAPPLARRKRLSTRELAEGVARTLAQETYDAQFLVRPASDDTGHPATIAPATATKTLPRLHKAAARAQQQVVVAEAERAAEVAAGQAARQRHQAALADLDTYLQESNERERANWEADRAQKAARLAEVRAVIDAPLPVLRTSLAEKEQALNDLGAFVDRHNAVEQDTLRKSTDDAESRRLWDFGFRQGYDARHPGGANVCQCPGHKAWRRET